MWQWLVAATTIVLMVAISPSNVSGAKTAHSKEHLLFHYGALLRTDLFGNECIGLGTNPFELPPPYMSITSNLEGSVQAGNLALGVPSYPPLAMYPSTPATLDAGPIWLRA